MSKNNYNSKKKFKKPKNFHISVITFMSDVFFKFALGRTNDPRCQKLRDFYIKNIIGYLIEGLQVTNPELTPEHALQMNNILDVLLENEDYVVDLEMENHKLDLFTCNRVEVYGAKTMAHAQIRGESYQHARKVFTIFIVNDSFNKSNQLIEVMSTGTEHSENHFTSGQDCHYKIFVQLPMIDKIAQEKDELSEFEALMYLTRHQTLKGIQYKEEEGMITIMKDLKAEFIAEAPVLYEAAKKREYYHQTIDYEAFAKSQAEEYQRRKYQKKLDEETKKIQDKAKETIALEAQSNIDKGEKQGERNALIDTCNLLIQLKYKRKRNPWLNHCTIAELRKVILYTQESDSHDYDDLLDFVFPSQSSGMLSR